MTARGPAALALVLLAGLGAWANAIAGAPAAASAQSAGPQSEAGGAGSPSTPTPSCPSPNPPNQLTLVGGTPQTAVLGVAFAGAFQVALSNSDGCAVTGTAGVAVTFSAPAVGASGVFSAGDSSTVTVGADASGSVTAPTFTANYTQGSYTVIASSRYGAVSFDVTNALAPGTWCPTLGKLVSGSAGPPVKLTAGVGETQSTRAGTGFPIRLAVTVTDAEGNPVAGALVAFEAPSHGASGRFTIRSHAARGHRSKVSHTRTAHVKTDACGIALAPPFAANRKLGGYVVEAGVKPVRPAAFALVNEAR